jgi:CHASE2 domain-containing sensor protein
MAIGAKVAGHIEAQHTPAASQVQAGIVKAKSEELGKLAEQIAKADTAAKPALEALGAKLDEEKAGARKAELKAVEWKPLWGKPAAFAGVILVLFVLLFRPPPRLRLERSAAV